MSSPPSSDPPAGGVSAPVFGSIQQQTSAVGSRTGSSRPRVEWLREVTQTQTSRMTAEQREQMRRRVEEGRQLRMQQQQVSSARFTSYTHQARFTEGLSAMASRSHDPRDRATAAREAYTMMSAPIRRDEVERFQMVSASRTPLSYAPTAPHHPPPPSGSPLLSPPAFGGFGVAGSPPTHMPPPAPIPVMLPVGGAAPPPGGVGGGAGGGGGEADMSALLEQLRDEPENDEERAEKFMLYETYGEKVEHIRKDLFTFWDANQGSFKDAAGKAVESRLRKLDTDESMGIGDFEMGGSPGRGGRQTWFVYHMIKRAAENNTKIENILKDLESKLEFMANNAQTECPICMGEFGEEEREAEFLPCCHQVCKECWAQWVDLKGAHGAFCPLCRHEAFVQEIVDIAQTYGVGGGAQP